MGYTIIENVISDKELISLRTDLDNIYKIQEQETGKENLKLINEVNLVSIPLAYSELFVKLASRTEMMAYVEKILGNFLFCICKME